MSKICSECKETKDFDCFYKSNKNSKDGYQSICICCSKAKAAKHYQNYKEEIKNRTKRGMAATIKAVLLIKEDYGCFNCGLRDGRLLDFHHLDSTSKMENVSVLARLKGKKKLLKEINKCVVACSNCHRLIHYNEINPTEKHLCNISLEEVEILLKQCKQENGIQTENIKKPRKDYTKKIYMCQCGKSVSNKAKTCRNCMKTKIVWPNKEELHNMVWKMPTLKVGEILGISDKAIEKRCKKYGIDKPPRGYWAKLESKK
jgi:hypothetical protein